MSDDQITTSAGGLSSMPRGCCGPLRPVRSGPPGAPADRKPVPIFAEHTPVVAGGVSDGARRVWLGWRVRKRGVR